MSAKHTPAPWAIRERKGNACFSERAIECLICAGTGNAFCIVELGGNAATSCQPEDVRANARLIAAAPELLEALMRIRDGIPAYHEGEFVTLHHDGDGNELGFERHDPSAIIQSIVGIACAAIAKALGEDAS